MSARKAPKSFAEARTRLDEILDELEREADDVDQLAARIQEAAGLLRFCRERLATARQEVTEVVAELADTPEAATASPEPSGPDAVSADDPDADESDADEDEQGAGGGALPF